MKRDPLEAFIEGMEKDERLSETILKNSGFPGDTWAYSEKDKWCEICSDMGCEDGRRTMEDGPFTIAVWIQFHGKDRGADSVIGWDG